MSVVLGKNLRIYAGTTGTSPLIAMAKNCTVSEKCGVIEKASATNQSSKEFEPDRSEWEVTLGHLVSSGAPFEGLIKVRGKYTLSVVIGTTRKTGTAICTQAELSGAVSSLFTPKSCYDGPRNHHPS